MLSRITDVVKNLLIINVLMFLLLVLASAFGGSLAAEKLQRALSLYYPDSPGFRPWQLVSYMFMHANEMHILFNMLWLFFLGPRLEATWGPKRFLSFYLICGVGSALMYLGVNAIEVFMIADSITATDTQIMRSGTLYSIYAYPMLGASGAVSGIMIAFAMVFGEQRMMLLIPPIPIKAKFLIGGLILMDIYFIVLNSPGDHVARWAHIGGVITGFLVIKFWQYDKTRFY